MIWLYRRKNLQKGTFLKVWERQEEPLVNLQGTAERRKKSLRNQKETGWGNNDLEKKPWKKNEISGEHTKRRLG